MMTFPVFITRFVCELLISGTFPVFITRFVCELLISGSFPVFITRFVCEIADLWVISNIYTITYFMSYSLFLGYQGSSRPSAQKWSWWVYKIQSLPFVWIRLIGIITLFESNLFSYQIEKFEFLFHEDSQYTGVWKYCTVCLKIDYTLRCWVSVSVSSPLRWHRLLLRS